MPQPPTEILYLSANDVAACLPRLEAQIDLAEEALRALGEGSEMPAKIGVHPRPPALLHAMPAWLRDRDLVGLKWISAFPGNAGRGLPAIQGLIVLNDPETGTPTSILEAGLITAARTAAVSGVALRWFAPEGARRAAILGAGVQARSHLPVLAAQLPGLELRIFDRHPERAAALAEEALAIRGVARAEPAPSAQEAVGDAEVVVTASSLGPVRQVMTPDWVLPGGLVVALDFSTYASAALARAAGAFVVDDREQFLAYREAGHFDDYPDPTTTLGEAAAAGHSGAPPARAGGDRVVLVNHLGVGACDVLFGDAVRRSAVERGLGIRLPR
jgi:ornithine cyclodeaminase/alanine dehydrogenase